MIIHRIHLRGFGRWIDQSFCFPEGLSFWSGPNEVGKTTLVQAILAGLYGLAKRRTALRESQERYRPWQKDAPFGVALEIQASGVRYRIERDFLSETARAYRWEGEDILPEKDPDQLIASLTGLSSPLLFCSTLLITQGEASAIQEGKPGEAIAKKVAAAEAETSTTTALRWMERELGLLVREGRTEATQSALQHARTKAAKWAALLDEMDVSAEREALLEQELQSVLAQSQELEAYRAAYSPLIERYRQMQPIKNERDQRRRAFEEALRDHAAIEKQHLRWVNANAHWTLFKDRAILAPERRWEVADLETDLRLAREQWESLNRRIELLKVELADLSQTMEQFRSIDSQLPTQEGWAHYLKISDRMTAAQTQMNALTELRDDLLCRVAVLGHWRRYVIAGALTSVFALLGWAFFRDEMGWLLIPSLLLVGFGIFHARANRRSNGALKRIESEWQQRVDEIEAFEKERRAALGGQMPGDYLTSMAAAESHKREMMELSGRIAVLIEEHSRLTNEAYALKDRYNSLQLRWNEVLQMAGVTDREGYLAHCGDYDRAAEEERLAQEAREQSLRGKTLDEWETIIAKHKADCHMVEMKLEAVQVDEEDIEVERHHQRLIGVEQELLRLNQNREILRERLRNLRESFAQKDRHQAAAEWAHWQDEVADLEQRAEGIRVAKALIEQVGQRVSQKLTPMLLSRSGDLFARMTGGRYQTLRLAETGESQEEFHVQVRESTAPGGWVEPEMLSSGARDQLYIALRIALGEYLTGREDFPLILDDPFIHLDPERLQSAIMLLRDLESQHQIIWLTKDPRLGVALPEQARRELFLS